MPKSISSVCVCVCSGCQKPNSLNWHVAFKRNCKILKWLFGVQKIVLQKFVLFNSFSHLRCGLSVPNFLLFVHNSLKCIVMKQQLWILVLLEVKIVWSNTIWCCCWWWGRVLWMLEISNCHNCPCYPILVRLLQVCSFIIYLFFGGCIRRLGDLVWLVNAVVRMR